MRSKKLGRAAAAASLMVLLAPGVAFASWWDGGYDGRYDNGYHARRGSDSSTTTTTRQAEPGYQSPPGSNSGDYGPGPGEGPPPDSSPPPSETQPPPPQQCGGGDCYNNAPPQQCGGGDCYNDTPPTTQGCGQGGCHYTPPPRQDCGQGGCHYTPPPCGQPSCGSPPPPSCGQPSCASAPPPPPPPPGAPIYGCENSVLAGTELALHKTTTPPPDTPVAPGDQILVDLTWSVHDWWAPVLHKALDCVYINGQFVPGLSLGERDVANSGHWATSYVVPLDAPVGGTICDQGFVSGPNPYDDYFREVSNVVCFPISTPPPPPPTCGCAPEETTTTTTAPEAQPYIESERLAQNEEAPPEVLPEAHDVLPRTGSGPGTARLAAASLGLVALIRRRLR